MLSLKVNINSRSGYQIDRRKLRQALIEEFKLWLVGEGRYLVSINLIGDRLMKRLNFKYLNKNKTTDVLSFPQVEFGQDREIINRLPNQPVFLGDIMISYPQAVYQSQKHQRLVIDEVIELAKHGLRHLLGIDHN